MIFFFLRSLAGIKLFAAFIPLLLYKVTYKKRTRTFNVLESKMSHFLRSILFSGRVLVISGLWNEISRKYPGFVTGLVWLVLKCVRVLQIKFLQCVQRDKYANKWRCVNFE